MTTKKFVPPTTTSKRWRQALAAIVAQETNIGTNTGTGSTTANSSGSTNTAGATGAGGSGSSLNGQAGGKVTANKVTQTMAFGGEIVIIDRIYPTLMQAVVVYRSTGNEDTVLIGSNMISDSDSTLYLPPGEDLYDLSVKTSYRKPSDDNITGIVMNIDGNINEMPVLLCYLRMPGEGLVDAAQFDSETGLNSGTGMRTHVGDSTLLVSDEDVVITTPTFTVNGNDFSGGIVTSGYVTIPSVASNTYGTVIATVPSGYEPHQFMVFTEGEVLGVVQVSSYSGTELTIAYQYYGAATNREIYWKLFTQ